MECFWNIFRFLHILAPNSVINSHAGRVGRKPMTLSSGCSEACRTCHRRNGPAHNSGASPAGPLVNVALIPVLSVVVSVSSYLGWSDTFPDARLELIHNVWVINLVLLVFNMMPPVCSLTADRFCGHLTLWFPLARANSLLVASIIGYVGLAGLILLAVA